VSAALLAAASGVGFGLFQSVNARAVRSTEDPWASAFVQVFIATLALGAAALATGELDEVADAPLWALGDFAVAGILHFLAGWTLLNVSQLRIGAARTSPLLTTVPLFGVVIAALTLGQLPGPVALVAIVLMCAGAWIVTMRGGVAAGRAVDAVPGLACAFVWALSPTFVLRGLEGFDSVLVGLVVGLVVSSAVYALALALARGPAALGAVREAALPLKLLAGGLVAVSTWWRWLALDGEEVGAVLALSLLSVPVVLVMAPLIAGRHVERVTLGLWAGAGLVIAGACVLVVT
jgi:uncharacterized membrane protein